MRWVKLLVPFVLALSLVANGTPQSEGAPFVESREAVSALKSLSDAMGRQLVTVGISGQIGGGYWHGSPSKDLLALVRREGYQIWFGDRIVLISASDQLHRNILVDAQLTSDEPIERMEIRDLIKQMFPSLQTNLDQQTLSIEGRAKEVGDCLVLLSELNKPYPNICANWKIVSLSPKGLKAARRWRDDYAEYWKFPVFTEDASKIPNLFRMTPETWLQDNIDEVGESHELIVRTGKKFSIHSGNESWRVSGDLKANKNIEVDFEGTLHEKHPYHAVLRIKQNQPLLFLQELDENRFWILEMHQETTAP